MVRTKPPKNNPNKDFRRRKPPAENNGKVNGKENGLTAKQNAFIQEYLIDLNATQAAIRAGYSKEAAGVVGCQNLKKPNIQQALQVEMEKRAQRTHVTQDKVVKELAKLAFSNLRSYVEWGSGRVKMIDSEKLTEEDAACVAEVSRQETQFGTSVKFKLHDKKGALELLGKHLGMFSDTIKHIGEGGGPIAHEIDLSDKSIKAAFDALYGHRGKGGEK